MKAHRLAAADFFYTLGSNEAAMLLDIEPAEAGRIRKMEEYQVHLEHLRMQSEMEIERHMMKDAERIRMAFSQMVPKAIEVLNERMSSDDGTVSLQAAREVLDRDGRMPKVSRVQSEVKDLSKLPDVSDAILQEFHPETKPN